MANGEERAEVGEATRREIELSQQRREAERREAERLVEDQNARTEAHRRQYEDSDQALAHRQVQEAERLMRGPSPVTSSVNERGERVDSGHVPGDPTKGPSH